MNSDTKPDTKFTKKAIEWRRSMVLSYVVKGWSQSDIAEKLKVSDALISMDVKHLRETSKEDMRTHIQETLPFLYSRAMTGINDLLRRSYETLDSTKDPKLQHQYKVLIMQLWGQLMSMATDGGVIEQAFKKVEQLSTKQPMAAVSNDANDKDHGSVRSDATEEDLVAEEAEEEEEETEEHE